jgi:protein TonB
MFLGSRGFFSLSRAALAPWMGVSLTVHAVGALLLAQARPGLERRQPVLFPLQLVGRPGGGGAATQVAGLGPPAAAPAVPPAPATNPAPPAPNPVQRSRPAPRPKSQQAAKPAAARPAQPAPAVAHAKPRPLAPEGAGGGGSDASPVDGFGPGSGGGHGGGQGEGAGEPVAYARNPAPPYPLAARRRGEEGVVVLDVLVGVDGSASQVSVRRSSGHESLDAAARETVERRWRFQPAVERGMPVSRRVAVPIRFRLKERG